MVKLGSFRITCIAALFSIVPLSTPAQTAAPLDRDALWQQDIQVLADTLSAPGETMDSQRGLISRGQMDFAKLYPPATFGPAIASLKADVPRLSDDEISLRIMQLMASARVAHNGAFPPGKGFTPHLPLMFEWYADGMAVYAGPQEYADALGARVVTIGDSTPEELLAKLAPFIPYETDARLRSRTSQFLMQEAILRHFNLIGPTRRVAITLQKPGQPPFTLSVALEDPLPPMFRLTHGLNVPTPLYLSRQTQSYWYQYLPDSQTLYVQYNRCQNDPKLSFSDFTKQAMAEADANPIKRVVLDLRLNGGGDDGVIAPLKDALAAHAKSIGHLYVLIGPGTYSSAMLNAADLQRSLKATVVGEPTGGTDNCYGELGQFVLPNSKIAIHYTTKYFGDPKAAPAALKPDIPAPRTLASDLAGRDSALEAAISAP